VYPTSGLNFPRSSSDTDQWKLYKCFYGTLVLVRAVEIIILWMQDSSCISLFFTVTHTTRSHWPVLFLTTANILIVKQPFYRKVLEEDQNYSEVHRQNNKYIEGIGDDELASGRRRGVEDLTPRWKTKILLVGWCLRLRISVARELCSPRRQFMNSSYSEMEGGSSAERTVSYWLISKTSKEIPPCR
jgi:hypothetical protein